MPYLAMSNKAKKIPDQANFLNSTVSKKILRKFAYKFHSNANIYKHTIYKHTNKHKQKYNLTGGSND